MRNNLVKNLGEVCHVIGGGTPKTNISEYWKGDIVWITPKDLGKLKETEISRSFKMISAEGLKESSARLLPKGSVILSSRAPIGYVAIAGVDLATNQGCRSFICDEGKIFNKYLYYFLLKNREYLNQLGGGSTFKEISGSTLKNIEISLPSIEEQKKIVARLDSQLAKIKEAKRLRVEADTATQNLLSAELHKIFEEGKISGWKDISLEELFDITSSKRVFKSEWTKQGVPFYRAREIVRLSKSQAFRDPIFISEKMYESYKTRYGVPEAGDILVTGVGTLGISYRVRSGDKFYFKDGNIIWLKRNSDVNSMFIEYFFQSALLKNQIESNAGGATVRTFTIKTAKSVKILLPPLEEQKKIVARLDALSDKIRKLQEYQKSVKKDLDRLEQSILHEAFSVDECYRERL